MADYSDDATLFTPDGVLRGSAALRRFFAELFEEFAKPGMSYELLRQEVSGYSVAPLGLLDFEVEPQLLVAAHDPPRSPVRQSVTLPSDIGRPKPVAGPPHRLQLRRFTDRASVPVYAG